MNELKRTPPWVYDCYIYVWSTKEYHNIFLYINSIYNIEIDRYVDR